MAAVYGAPRSPHSSSLADVLDILLDKGLVIDVYVRVSLVGIELLTIDARIVVASVDTYLRFAQAVNRLELGGGESNEERGLPEAIGKMEQGGAESKTRGALSGVKDAVQSLLPEGHDEEQSNGQHERSRGESHQQTRRREEADGARDSSLRDRYDQGDESDESDEADEGEEPEGRFDEDIDAEDEDADYDDERGARGTSSRPSRSYDDSGSRSDQGTSAGRRVPRDRRAPSGRVPAGAR